MSVYRPRPQIACRAPFSGATSCGDIMGDMPASADIETFGPINTPGITEIVPQELASRR